MSNITRQNVSYALNQPLNLDAPFPIVAKRAPTTADKAQIGTQWVNTVTNSVYFLSSIANNSANWVNVAGGAGLFTSLTVTPGPTSITGSFTLIAGTNTAHIADDATAHDVILGTTTGTAQTTIRSGTGGLVLNPSNGVLLANSVFQTAASPTATLTFTATLGVANFSGFTTAAAASQNFTIVNAGLGLLSGFLVSASNGGANDAQMTITRVNPQVGSFIVTLKNNGAAALNGDVNIYFWIYTF